MNWSRSLLAVAAGVPLLALLAFGLTRDPREIPSPLPGRAAPPFALPMMRDGATTADTVRLTDHRGEVVVVNFWASWCLECRYEHRALSNVASAFAGQGVRFFGILYNDVPSRGDEWIRAMGGQSYPALVDRGTRTAIDYGVYGIPETFIIDATGTVAYKHIGPITERLLVEKIEQARSASRPVEPVPGSGGDGEGG
ncbi:MAG TPA: redoxin domain-containing protein [Gemmatimonadaceae bacterium]|nr:redoxin domain-containing protein [Gemmatimonadaceae bacterium]